MTNLTRYEILKIENTASTDEIKRAYYKLVRQFPPERFPDEFFAIKEAYELLSDAQKRTKYDLELNRKNELIGDLPIKAALQIEQAKTEIQNAHTGNAVKAAEDLYARYPENAAVISLLRQAYIARGWTKKATDLLISPAYKKTLKTADDWEVYTGALRAVGFSEEYMLSKTIEGMAALSESGADDIEMCACAYYDFMDLSQWERLGLVVPEKFDDPDKILHYVLELSERGLKAVDADAFIASVLTPIVYSKSPSQLDDHDIAQLRIILKIIRNAINADLIEQSQYNELIRNIEYIVAEENEPAYQLEPVRIGKKIGRNDPCPCGSGKKYKKCCGR